MVREYEKIGDIKETHSLRVSARGNGLCFYIPKEITDLYNFLSGDMVKLEFRDHFRKKKEDDDQEGGKLKRKRENFT